MVINLEDEEIPKCPNCNNQMVAVWYHVPNELIKKFADSKQIFYKGLEDKEVDIFSSNRISYHCYYCNRSYSRDLERFIIEESNCKKVMEEAQAIIDKLVCELANDIINDLDNNTIEELKLKPEYSHFGFGLYIRNKYIYNNKKNKYRIDADHLSSLIYDKILEIISNQ